MLAKYKQGFYIWYFLPSQFVDFMTLLHLYYFNIGLAF